METSVVLGRRSNLPSTVRELAKIVTLGKQKYKARQAQLEAIKTLVDIEESETAWKVLMESVISELETTWLAHAKLGYLLGPPEEAMKAGVRDPSNVLEGSDHNARTFARGFFRALAGNKEKAVKMWKGEEEYMPEVPAGFILEYVNRMLAKEESVKYYAPYLAFQRSVSTPSEDVPELPGGKYNVIYADPPWPVSQSDWDMEKWSDTETIMEKYPTISVEAIGKMKAGDLAADRCSLFLWATQQFLPDALNIMGLWGFKYHVCITWDKGGGWTNFGFHRRTEFLLYGRKGKINMPFTGEAFPTLIVAPRGRHSEKPAIIREMIEQRIPSPRIELFARARFENWNCWGNEIQDAG